MSRRHVTECQVARNSQLVLHALGGPGRPTATRGTTWPRSQWVSGTDPGEGCAGWVEKPSTPGGNQAERLLRVLTQLLVNSVIS